MKHVTKRGLNSQSQIPPYVQRQENVFQGKNVRDENSDHALFNELGSSPASMEAAKLLDAFGSQPGFSKQQADAIQAYIPALFTGVPKWLSLPRNRWPKDWERKCWQPMVPMLLALYGHPDSGGIWEILGATSPWPCGETGLETNFT